MPYVNRDGTIVQSKPWSLMGFILGLVNSIWAFFETLIPGTDVKEYKNSRQRSTDRSNGSSSHANSGEACACGRPGCGRKRPIGRVNNSAAVNCSAGS